MKKIISLILAMLSVLTMFAACGKETNTTNNGEFDENQYIGEALLSTLGMTVDRNMYFYNEVFVLGTLETDEKETKEQDGETWALVTESYFTYSELESALRNTYQESEVKAILEEYDYYADIDGKLYKKLSAEKKEKSGKHWVRSPEERPELVKKTELGYFLEYTFKCDEKTKTGEISFYKAAENQYRMNKMETIG